ncbi:MAG: helix-turn-helix domain-containing protein [Candidatus Spyradocola sp.]
MKCTEKGTLPGSEYYFFTAVPQLMPYYLFVTVIGHFYCESGYRVTRPGAHDPLLIYVHQGALCLDTESGSHRAEAGMLLLVDCMVPHTYYCPDHAEIYFFHFSGEHATRMIRMLIRQYGACAIRSAKAPYILSRMRKALHDLASGGASTGQLSRMAYSALSHLQDFDLPISAEPELQNPYSDLVNQTVHEIRSRLMQRITVEELAAAVSISPSHLAHIFKQETGLSPIAYAAMLKIELAKILLDTTDQSVESIAETLCYASSASFINAFHRRTGTTPLAWRRRAPT